LILDPDVLRGGPSLQYSVLAYSSISRHSDTCFKVNRECPVRSRWIDTPPSSVLVNFHATENYYYTPH
jgi:hypothetical protein